MGGQLALGRSKLHQLREAVLHLNLSILVTESLAVLRSWKAEERNFVVKEVYSTEKTYRTRLMELAESCRAFSSCYLSLAG